ncbi:MAG: hypothetical protein M3Y46_09410 [Actinomycetota bacterium]|nr:hypothetical protein [Actinomycetota bacterium]
MTFARPISTVFRVAEFARRRAMAEIVPPEAANAADDVLRAGRPPSLDRRWLVRWIGVVTAAEALGFVVPAILGVIAADSSWFVPLLLIAGAAEGALLGAGQAVVLRQRLVGLRQPAWVVLTAAGAVVAYCAGLIPSTFADVWTQWGVLAQALLLTVVAVVLLLSIGTAQWVELRRHVPRAGWWILGTAVAWLVALGLFLAIATPLWHEGQNPVVAVLVGVMAGLVMAAAMATVTRLVLKALTGTRVRRRSAQRRRVDPVGRHSG